MKQLFFIFFHLIATCTLAQKTYSIADVPTEMMKGANSILIEENMDCDVSKKGRLRYKVKRVRAILNTSGHEDFPIVIHFNDDQKVVHASLIIYDAFGNELKKFKKKDFLEFSATNGFSLYSDARVLHARYIPTSYPYIMEFSYETESRTTAFLPRWYPVGGYNRSTVESTYTLTFDPKNKPRYSKNNLEKFPISVKETETQIIVRAAKIGVIPYEDLAPPFSEIAPNMMFALNTFYLKGLEGKANNWKEFGSWMDNFLLQDVAQLSEETKAHIRNLTQGVETPLEKAKIVYEYVQHKVRYISIQIGIGGWKPMTALEVDELSYGDCKGLSNYTKALLDAVGVESHYTILYAGDEERDISDDFTAMQGNHAIIGIPTNDDYVWLECTSQDLPFGFGGNFSDDRDVLVVTPNGGEIVRTKKYGFEQNTQKSAIKVNVTPSGGIKGEMERVLTGLRYYDEFMISTLSQQETEKKYLEKWDQLNGMNIASLAITDDKDAVVFSEILKFELPTYASKAGNDLLFNPNIFNRSSFIPSRDSNRLYDLVISDAFTENDIISIQLPENYTWSKLPETVTINSDFGSYMYSCRKVDDHTIEYARTFILKKGRYSKELYTKYRDFRKKIAKEDSKKLLLTSLK